MVLTLLFLSFNFNSLHVADTKEFSNYQHDTESLIIGRMVRSRQLGIISDGGLTGAGIHNDIHTDWISPEQVQNQYLAYLEGRTFTEYSPYLSQTGGQAFLFSLLDNILPFPPQTRLTIFYLVTSLLSAIVLTWICLWFFEEFGLWVAILIACSMIFSPIMIVLGRNLWWSLWVFYLPMIMVMEFLKRNNMDGNRFIIWWAALIFGLVLVKCILNGYEYITTTLIMMVTPFVYYTLRDRLSGRQFLTGFFVAIMSSLLAVLISFSLLSFQVAAAKGIGLAGGVHHIAISLLKRTYGNPQAFPVIYAASLSATTGEVVAKYLKDSFIDLNPFMPTSNSFLAQYIFKIRYVYLIGLFLAMSILAFLQTRSIRQLPDLKQKKLALIAATWFSILAPLSWYIIFKAHSFIHTHLNNILWQMPFLLFGFAVCGVAINGILPRVNKPAEMQE